MCYIMEFGCISTLLLPGWLNAFHAVEYNSNVPVSDATSCGWAEWVASLVFTAAAYKACQINFSFSSTPHTFRPNTTNASTVYHSRMFSPSLALEALPKIPLESSSMLWTQTFLKVSLFDLSQDCNKFCRKKMNNSESISTNKIKQESWYIVFTRNSTQNLIHKGSKCATMQ